MDRKRLGWALAALGAILVVISAFAEPMGIGDGDGFGWKQTTGVVVGGAAVVLGLLLARRSAGGSAPADL